MKLIAIDLDGTLLNSQNEISDENKTAIKQAQKAGIEVVIATGRAHFDVQEIFKDTEISTWIIAANGATIHSPDGKLFSSVPIDKETALQAIAWLEEEGYYYEVFSNEAIYTPQKGRELLEIEMDRVKSANEDVDRATLEEAAAKQYSQSGFSFISSPKELEPASIDIFNILAFSFHQEKLNKGWEKFKGRDDLTLVTSAHHNFELEHSQASKGHALTRLASNFNIPLHETMAIGDSMNDFSMMAIAGKRVAMGNARPEIQHIADEITLRNDEHGVAEALKKIYAEKASAPF
ncbi:Cof-type HAD-IIB family hydrolase [Jeotgalibacillus soli]|uniref:Cof-type HAD-IIB family hydrolase n=1 Tax=Jeotgalibacillus soli TaxID=889306 RepID=UPI00059717F7|nr:Cof-type HAD-IIB family hydrolase [Jeotgalibacillus soli]